MKKVVIIGGGASGIMAAITAAKHGADVTILEHKDRIGKKILMTGNGKCNLSNLSFSCDNYYSDTPEFIGAVFQQFSVADTLDFFHKIGLLTKEKKGYLYPMSEQASTVLDILRIELHNRHVKIVTDCNVKEIKYQKCDKDNIDNKNNIDSKNNKDNKDNKDSNYGSDEELSNKAEILGGEELSNPEERLDQNSQRNQYHQPNKIKITFQVTTDKGTFSSDALILACGSKAAPQSGSDGSGYALAESMGHKILTPLPALVQLRCDDLYNKTYMKSVAGVRCEAGLRLYVSGNLIKEEFGELQLTDYGISGIPVFQLSRIASRALYEHQKVMVEIDLLPSMNQKEIRTYLMDRAGSTRLTAEEAMLGMLNKKLLSLILKLNQVKLSTPWQEVQKNSSLLDQIVNTIKSWRIRIKSTNPFQNAQVCCGGVDCKELKDTLESKKVKNLYFAGEIIDIDGICGGYNLQWAWTTGYIAGCNSSKEK